MPAVPFGSPPWQAGEARHFRPWRVRIAPGAARAYDAGEWSGALVVIECGRLELEWPGGARLGFEAGDTLYLEGLGLVALRALGPLPVLLLVLRRGDGGAARARSC